VSKILVCDSIAEEGVAKLREAGSVHVSTGLSEEQLIEAARDACAIMVRSSTYITAPVIRAAPELRVVGRAGVGVDNIDVDAATAAGVVVVNSPSGNTVAAAEHTIAMMMAVARRIPFAHSRMLARDWAKSKCLGTEVRGKILGVVGLGKIGTEVARRAKGLEMQVIAHDPMLSEDHMQKMGVEPVSLDDLLARSDFVTLHVPGGAKTAQLINEDALAKMKPAAFLINCSRGAVLDEAAVARALSEGRLAGAAIDVFQGEPNPWSSPLLDAPNVVLTPHLGASTVEAQLVASLDVAEQICDVLAGRQARSAVNLPRVPAETAEELRPWMGLAERVGMLVANLAQSGLRSAQVEYLGELRAFDCSLLTRAVLVGLLSRVGTDNLNIISAPAVAKQRGVAISETKGSDRTPYHSVVRVIAHTREGDLVASGTLRGLDEPRIVRVGAYQVDFVPSGGLLMVWFRDIPGVIGAVGTLMGEAGVNIGQMHVGRCERGGTALMILNVDQPVSEATADAIRALPTVEGLRLMDLPPA